MSTVPRHPPYWQPRPLDDLSPGAIALLAFIRRHHYPRWYVGGSLSARYAMELARAGSRLSRGDNAKSLVKDIVFRGGRFISASEGIDTNRKGWKMIVGISELHHSRSNDDTAERVRGGQEGRVRDGNGSAGDWCYGYGSIFEDPAYAANYYGRGPKPKRIVVIDEPAAKLVREVHRQFAEGESMAGVVRWWNAHRAEYPPITDDPGAPVRIDHVRNILHNKKYIGIWEWGKTTTVYDGHGNHKAVPARPDQTVTCVQRPLLRIVDQDVWERTQLHLAKLKDIYGMKPEGKKRGCAVHYRQLYERSLLRGKVICGSCGSRLLVAARLGEKRLACPMHRQGKCPVIVRVPYERAERGVIDVLSDVLKTYPDWLKTAADSLRQRLHELAATAPGELTQAEAELEKVSEQLQRLVQAVADGHLDGQTVRGKTTELEARKGQLQESIAELRRSGSASMQVPDDAWIAAQFMDLSSLLHEEMPVVARAIRPLIATAVAEWVLPNGLKHGHIRLRFTISGWAVLAKMLANRLPATVLSKLTDGAEGAAGEFTLEFGRETCITQWGPIIAGWREQNVPWSEIRRRSGLKRGTAFYALEQWKKRRSR